MLRMKSVTVMRCRVVDLLAHGHNSIRIDRRMAPVVMVLDVPHVHRLTNAWDLVQILSIIEQIRILPNELLVALEVHQIHRIETDERHEQSNVGFRQFVSRNVALLGQNGLALLQCGEERVERRFVGLLFGGEAAAVHTVVDVREYPPIDFIDGGLQMRRVEVQLRVLGDAIVELVVEHSDDLGALIADDLVGFFVPEHRDGVPA